MFLNLKIFMKNKIYFFLDRDGTIIHHVHYLRKVSKVKLYKFTIKALKILRKYGKIFVITNQSAVSRGLLKEKNLKKINNHVLKKINAKQKIIEKIFYCPHHTNAKIKKYRKDCIFRKPGVGFVKRFNNIDKKKSWFIGDTNIDIKTGLNANLNTILLKTGKKYKNNFKITKSVMKCKNLYVAAKFIEKNLKIYVN